MSKATLTPDNRIRIQCSYEDRHFIKQIPGRMYNAQLRVWEIPCNPESIKALTRALPLCDVSNEVDAAADTTTAWRREVQRVKDAPATYWPGDIAAEPYQHQRQALQVGMAVLGGSLGCGIFHEVGCGKSLIAISILSELKRSNPDIEKVLIVCPASVVGVWESEIKKFARFPNTVMALVGPVKKRIERLLG